MSNELATNEPTPLTRPLTATEMLVQRALDQGMDPGKLYDILATERADARKQQYSAALAEFQARVQPVVKATHRVVDRSGNTIDYASLADIRRHVDPVLHDLGLTLSYDTTDVGGEPYAMVKLTHRGGHTETARLPFRAAKPPGASNDAQAIGSGQTYAMRYLTVAILGLWFVDADTDAEPAATVVPGPTLSEDDVLELTDAIIDAAERTGHDDEELGARIRKAHNVSRMADIPVAALTGILDRLKGMQAK